MIRRLNQIVLFAVIFCVNQQYLFGANVGKPKYKAAKQLSQLYNNTASLYPYADAREYYFQQINSYASKLREIYGGIGDVKQDIEIRVELYGLRQAMQEIADDLFMGDSDDYDRDVIHIFLLLEKAELYQHLKLGDNPKPPSFYSEKARQYYFEKIKKLRSIIQRESSVNKFVNVARISIISSHEKKIERLKGMFAELFEGGSRIED